MNKFERQSAIFTSLLALVLAGLIFLAWMASPLFAQQPNSHTKQDRCQTLEQFVEGLNRLPAQLRNTLRIRILDGEQAQRWVTAFNAIPPQSAIIIHRVALVSVDDPSPVIFAGEVDGCIAGVARMPYSMHTNILRDANLEPGDPV